MKACDGVVQLSSDAYGVLGAAHTAIEDRGNVEFACDGANIHVLPLEVERRCARRDTKLVDTGEGVQQFLCETVRKILLFLVPADIYERQHSERVWRRGELGFEMIWGGSTNSTRCDRWRCRTLVT